MLGEKEIVSRLVELGVEPKPSTPEELGARMKSEITRWAKVIADGKITVE